MDEPLRGIERTAAVTCVLLAFGALAVSGGRPEAPLGVLGGGLLAGISYWTLKGGIFGLLTGAGGGARSGRGSAARYARVGARVALRYALLGLLAYVMIARLHLHPLGLLAGASSVVAAVSFEAVRLLFKKS